MPTPAKPVKELTGIVFPPGPKGDRSTLAANKTAIVAALTAVDSDAASALASDPSSWRFAYQRGFLQMFRASIKSPAEALSVAEAGLAHLHTQFQFIDPVTKQTSTLADAMAAPVAPDRAFHTARVDGGAPMPAAELEVPYKKGAMLRGEALVAQLDAWVLRGTVEESAARAVRAVMAKPAWLDLRDKYFVLLGAGSAMGPLNTLLARGANVIAIDLDRPKIWTRLIDLAAKSPGKLIFPVKVPQDTLTPDTLPDHAGCNLFTDTPRILHWLTSLHPEATLIVGSYAYLDGALHVQVSLAMDAIISGLIAARGPASVIPAYLHTPTDVHVIPASANEMAARHYSRPRSLLRMVVDRAVGVLSSGNWLAKNALPPVVDRDGQDIFYVDSLSTVQGPNYALAKRLQQWRAIVARDRMGCTVSANVAPASFTASNLHVRTVGWALKGMSYFDAMEVFPQATTNTLMTTLLLYDINDKMAAGNPEVKLRNPLELNAFEAVHGGTFRAAYKMGTMGQMAAAVYFAKRLRPLLLLAAVIAFLAYVIKVERVAQ